MKILQIIGLVLLVIIALPLVIALFVKKDYAIEREIIINSPSTEVYTYLKYLNNHRNFSVWEMADPNLQRAFRGVDGTLGAVSAWDSKMDSVGKGEMEIVTLTEGRHIDLDIRFFKPFAANAKGFFATDASGENAARVRWGFKSRMAYPFNLFLLLGMENKLGNDLQKGLNNLKNILEK